MGKKEKLFICQDFDKQEEEIKKNLDFIFKELLENLDKYSVHGFAYVSEHGEVVDMCYTNELPTEFITNPKPGSCYVKWSLKKEKEEWDENKPYWIYHKNEKNVRKYSNNYPTGKWMLFYPKSSIDDAWKQAKNKYENNKLIGITSMKRSTNRKNPRANNNKEGIIIFYCSGKKEDILKYGYCILKELNYCLKDTIFYKTDEQTYKGTRATGQKKNYSYKINNPMILLQDDY